MSTPDPCRYCNGTRFLYRDTANPVPCDYCATTTIPTAELARLRAVETAAIEVVNAFDGQRNVRHHADRLAFALMTRTTPTPDPRDERIRVLEEALRELADLMDDVRAGAYEPDSFTTQTARAALTPRSDK